MTNNSNENLEYTRRLYDNVLDWYKNADTKAQVVLAINGGFITFVGSSVFKQAKEVKSLFDSFDCVTWIILALMIASLIGSIGTAIYCLWSRIYSEKNLRKIIEDALKNVALLCSNCHRMIHRRREKVLLVSELIDVIDFSKIRTTKRT